MAELAPGRSCGECNACCRYYDLMKDFHKPQGILCDHWKSGIGCSIHARRPSICRDFYCHWLQNPQLDDAWRPDRSGFIIRDTREDIPAHWPMRQGLVFELCGPESSIDSEDFIRAVATQVLMGVPVFLSVHGPMGFGNMNAFLNEILAPAAAALDAQRIAATLRQTLRDLRAC